MIKSLTIRKYILIDELTIDFRPGMTVITGETGAGKSILVGALNILCGARTDTKVIRPGADKCIIEGCFDITGCALESLFEEYDIDYDDEAVIRREITANGKTRAFINDTPTNISVLRKIGERLIDIHSQHQNLLLADNTFQLDAIDLYSGDEAELSAYHTAYAAYREKERQLNEAESRKKRGDAEEEYLKYVYEQLSQANLQEDEEEQLEEEQTELAHAEEIKSALYTAVTKLDEENGGALTNIRSALAELRSVESKIKIAELAERAEQLYIEAKDIASELFDKQERINCDPARLEQVEERLSQIYTLKKRYSKENISQLITLRDETKKQLDTIADSGEEIERLQKEKQKAAEQMNSAAEELRKKRREAAARFSKKLEEMVRPLAMPNIRFSVEWQPMPEPDKNGTEQAVFCFSANKNMPLSPVAASASGGEISRLMLCIKAMIAAVHGMPAILFDEIDTGISGETAGRVGGIMEAMSAGRQVIVITHLPQVASKGDTHYKVEKDEESETVTVNILPLDRRQRVEEIARMMSGPVLTEAAIKHAGELLTEKH